MDNPTLSVSNERLPTTGSKDAADLIEMCSNSNGSAKGNLSEDVSTRADKVDSDFIDQKKDNDVLYGLQDVPPWYIAISLGFQHNLEMITSAVAVPFLLTPALCMENDDPDKAAIISSLIFMSGVITILQSTVGNTLPIVQGGSFSYLIPSLAIMNLPKWKCPANLSEMSQEEKTEEWQMRMREIQGAIIFASMFEMMFALTGCIGYLTKFVTPITVAPAITLIGLSLFKNVMKQCSKNYYVAFSMTILLIVFSQHLRNVTVPLPTGKKGSKNEKRSRFPIFQVLPILLALLVLWAVCGILTLFAVLPEGDPARVDAKKRIIEEAPWFHFPYPCKKHSLTSRERYIPYYITNVSKKNKIGHVQFGIPTVSIGAVLGILCGVLTSTVESIGDYYCCASIIKAPVPPEHAMNRGIFIEGLGCVLSGIVGTGNASTSYSHNIGTLGITKVGSRRVIQVAGMTMLVLGLVGKAGTVFVSLPDPILGGMFLFLFPLVMSVGLSTLKDVSLESSRNIFIVSFSIFLGLAVSQWMNTNPGMIKTGTPDLDSLLEILLSTGMFVAGFTAFLLDNTVSGTDEERGLGKRHAAAAAQKLGLRETTYDLPFGMSIIKRFPIFKWIPISPTYERHPMTLLRCGSDSGDPDPNNATLPIHLSKKETSNR